MIRILGWLKERRIFNRRSFVVSLESKDRGLYYRAIIHYRWRLNLDSSGPRPLAPDALAQYLLREELDSVAGQYRLLDHEAAKSAMNALLSRELCDAEERVRVEGRVQLRIAKSDKHVALKRAEEETALRSAHARQTVELELLLDRLTDQTLGPVWWVSRYADLQFATGDPQSKVKSVLGAFAELQKALHSAKLDQITDEKLLVRRKIEEVFSAIEDEQSLSLALQVMNHTLDHLGVRRVDLEKGSLNGSGRGAASDSSLADLE